MKKVVHWWISPLVAAFVINSIYWSSNGAWADSVSQDDWVRWAWLGGIAIANIGCVALGYVGKEHFAYGNRLEGWACLLFALAGLSVTYSFTKAEVDRVRERNENIAAIEAQQDATNENSAAGKQLQAARDRVTRAESALAPLKEQAAVAKTEFERESASGFGPRATQRKAEWDAAVARFTEAQTTLVEAETALTEAEAALAPKETSDAALAALIKEPWAAWVQEWFLPGLIEGLPMLSGWLFVSYRREERADREALMLDQLGELSVAVASLTRNGRRTIAEEIPDEYRPKGNGESTGTAQAVWEQTADPEPDGDDTPDKRVKVSDERRKLMPPKKGDLKLVAGE